MIAHPNLLDPNFRRTVLYLVSYEANEGALGVVLNRPSGKTVAELLTVPGLGLLGQIPVFFGGPVSRDRLSFAVFEWERESKSVACRLNLELNEAKALAAEGEGTVWAFVGYAGWTGGQLERELEEKAWLVQKPGREMLDPELCKTMWRNFMRSHGPWFRLLADAPDDPSLN